MATRLAILVDGTRLSEQAVRYTLAAGPGAYDTVQLVGAIDKRYLDQLAGPALSWVKTAVLPAPVAESLPKYMREQRIDLLQMTTPSSNGSSRIWRVRVRNGRVRGVESQALMSRPCAA
jgi:hypothetical protein